MQGSSARTSAVLASAAAATVPSVLSTTMSWGAVRREDQEGDGEGDEDHEEKSEVEKNQLKDNEKIG